MKLQNEFLINQKVEFLSDKAWLGMFNTKLSFMPLMKTTCPGTSAESNVNFHTSTVGLNTVDSKQTDVRFSEYDKKELESCTDSGMALPVNERP